MSIEIGAFVRPWNSFPFDEALRGVKEADYGTVGLLGGSSDTSLDLRKLTESVPERVAAQGLTANLACLHVDHELGEDEALASVRAQVEQAAALKVSYLMTFGADHEPQHARWYRAAREAAAHAELFGITLVFKPHGGCTTDADALLKCIDEIAHENAKIFYDAGNIIYYNQAGDPVADAKRVAPYVAGFCAKDCGGYHSDVMIQFGDGSVDFPAVFDVLLSNGFNGPVMVECCRTGTWEETTASAARNRAYLEALLG
ncbi:MAG: sugar phosphate isomerase/epimerase [Armatimonas sp.]